MFHKVEKTWIIEMNKQKHITLSRIFTVLLFYLKLSFME